MTIGDALTSARSKDAALEIRDAVRRLANCRIADLLRLDIPSEAAWHALFEFPERELVLLQERVYADDRPATLQDLSDQFRVTRERVRQIEIRTINTLRTRFESDPDCAPLRHLAARMRRTIGSIERRELVLNALDEAAHESSAGAAPHTERMRRNFLLECVGPFTHVGELLATSEATEALQVGRKFIEGLSVDSLLDTAWFPTLIDSLAAPSSTWDALAHHLGIRAVDGHFVRWCGSMADRAVAVLAARGEPMTIGQLHGLIDSAANPRGLSQQVQGDQRIMRRGKDNYGLRSWGGEEYSGIVSELEEELERRGGWAELDDLVEVLVREFGVSAQSVRSYAMDRRFVRREDGKLGFRSAEHPDTTYRPQRPESTRGLFHLRGAWHLRVEVSEDVLRGSGTMTRRGVAVAAGLEPDLTLGFEYVGGSVTFSWSRTQPSIGSLRTIALAHGCSASDLMFLPLSGPEPRPVIVTRGTHLARASGVRRLLLEVGLDPDESDDTGPTDVARTVGLPAGADWHDVADRLRERGEDAVLDLFPVGWT